MLYSPVKLDLTFKALSRYTAVGAQLRMGRLPRIVYAFEIACQEDADCLASFISLARDIKIDMPIMGHIYVTSVQVWKYVIWPVS